MLDPIFADKKRPPAPDDLAAALGTSDRLWSALLAHISVLAPDAIPEWKHYAGKSGWQLVLRRSGRNFAYLKPLEGRFLFALAFNEAAVKAAPSAKLPKDILALVAAAPKSPEGHGVRIIVESASAAKSAKALAALKAAH